MAITGAEIREEIAKLRQLRDQVPPHTMFGDSNIDAIDAQIEVLEEDLTEEDIANKSQENEDDDDESLWPLRIRDAAMEARNWLDGQDEDSPSKGWADLVKAKEDEKRREK